MQPPIDENENPVLSTNVVVIGDKKLSSDKSVHGTPSNYKVAENAI